MPDILLTHSYHLADDPKQLRKMQPYAPLGTLYAAAALRDAGHTIHVLDSTLRDPRTTLASMLHRHAPRIVVIYEDDFNFLSKMCLLTMRELAFSIARTASEYGAVVVAHGSDATDTAAEYLRAGANFVLTGEAEATLPALCHRILAHEPVSDVPGVLWIDAQGKMIRSTEDRPRNTKWALSSPPAREFIDIEPYRRSWKAAHGRFSANIVASRGCPYSCNWCAKPISGSRFQLRSADAVAKEMRELKTLYGAQHIWFSDDIFGLQRSWLRDFACAVRKHDARLPYKIQARADLINEEAATLLADSGCSEVWMGVESGSQRVLDAMDKRLRVSHVFEATQHLRSRGISACYFLQLGYPGEGWPEILETLALVRQAKPDDIGVSISYPLPGTVFHERVEAEIAAKRNWAHSDDLCAMFSGAYSNDFYRSVRDALHAEVASSPNRVQNDLWHDLELREPFARRISESPKPSIQTPREFLPLSSVLSARGVA